MYRFHAAIHAAPSQAEPSGKLTLDGREYATLPVSPQTLNAPLPVTFEQAMAALETLPRMFCEPDGSWVWVGESGGERWQVDGCLYDRGSSLQYVELRGACPAAQFDQLLTAFGWPTAELALLLTQHGALLAELEFRRWAEAER